VDKINAIIASSASTTNVGVANSVIVGGTGTIGKTDNLAYVNSIGFNTGLAGEMVLDHTPSASDFTATLQARTGTISYIDQIGGQNVNANITGPAVGQDGYVIAWNNTNNEYELVPDATGGGTIYTTNSNIGSGRVATLTDTLAIGSGLLIRDNELAMNTTVTGGGAGLFVKGTGVNSSAPIAEFYGINANNGFGKTVIGNNQYGATLAMYNEVGVEKIRLVSTTNNNSFIDGSLSVASTNLPQAQLEVTGMVRAMSGPTPTLTTGKSIEFYYNSSFDLGRIFAYDRDTAQWKDMVIGNGINGNKFTIFADGKVSIGQTVSNGAKLEVQAISNGTDKALAVRNNTNTADLFRVLGNGNVGIGNVTPTQKLEVVGTAWAKSRTQVGQSGIWDGTNQLTIDGGGNTAVQLIEAKNGAGTMFAVAPRGNGSFGSDYNGTAMLTVTTVSQNTHNVQSGIKVLNDRLSSVTVSRYGAYIETTGAGTTQSNIGLYVRAVNNTNANYSIIVPSGGGNMGVGTLAPTSLVTVNGDVETLGSTDGYIVLDRTNGNKYRIYTDGGVLNTELVP
jgi:hypothetical protein